MYVFKDCKHGNGKPFSKKKVPTDAQAALDTVSVHFHFGILIIMNINLMFEIVHITTTTELIKYGDHYWNRIICTLSIYASVKVLDLVAEPYNITLVTHRL